MGGLISYFRRQQPNFEQELTQLDADIKRIEERRQLHRLQQKKCLGTILLSSIVIWLAAVAAFFFLFMKPDWRENLIPGACLFAFPLLMVFIRRLVGCCFTRKIQRDGNRLDQLHQQQQAKLEEIKRQTNYDQVKKVLDKYTAPATPTPAPAPAVPTPAPQPNGQTGRDRAGPASNATQRRPGRGENGAQAPRPGGGGAGNGGRGDAAAALAAEQKRLAAGLPPSPRVGDMGVKYRKATLPQERGYMDKLVDYLVGEGPGNRYALICKRCRSHNGLALPEEFENMRYICFQCGEANGKWDGPPPPAAATTLLDRSVSSTEFPAPSAPPDYEELPTTSTTTSSTPVAAASTPSAAGAAAPPTPAATTGTPAPASTPAAASDATPAPAAAANETAAPATPNGRGTPKRK